MTTNLSHSEFTQLASEQQIEKTVQALQAHGIRVVVFDTGEEARKYVLDLSPMARRSMMRPRVPWS